jgi:hypothetical protein
LPAAPIFALALFLVVLAAQKMTTTKMTVSVAAYLIVYFLLEGFIGTMVFSGGHERHGPFEQSLYVAFWNVGVNSITIVTSLILQLMRVALLRFIILREPAP